MDFDLEEATAILRRTPATLTALLRDLPEAWSRARDGEGEWSPYDVAGHLLLAEQQLWIPRLRIVLEPGEASVFTPFQPDGFLGALDGWDLGRRLDGFARAREESLRALAALRLGPAELARPGRHPDLGPVTAGQLLATWVAHDLNHLGQIVDTLARQYRQAVGPWRAYLGILQ